MPEEKRYVVKNIYGILLVPCFIALAAFVSLLVFSAAITRLTEENTFSTLVDSTEQQVMLFNVSIEGQIRMLTTLADNISVEISKVGDLKEIIPRLEMMKYSSNFLNVGVFGRDGRGYLSTGDRVDVSGRDYFQKSMLYQTVVEKVDSGLVAKKPRFIISVPIINGNSVDGVLFGSYDFSRFKSIAKIDVFDVSSYSFIVDEDGRVVIGTDNRNFLLDNEMLSGTKHMDNFLELLRNSRLDRIDTFEGFMKNFKSEHGGMFGYSFRGNRRYAVYQPLGVNGWYLFNVIDAAVVDGQKNRILHLAYMIIGMVVLCSALFIVYIYKLNAKKNRELMMEEERLRQSEELYRIAANLSDAVLVVVDIANDTVRYNKNFEEKFGYKPRFFTSHELDEHFLSQVFEEDREMVRRYMTDIDCGDRQYALDFRAKNPAGEFFWIRVEFVKLFDSYGKLQRVICRLTNIDEEKRSLQQLRTMADSDALTGMLNRKAAVERMESFLDGEGASGIHAFFIIDIDNFKEINDRFGHIEGDRVLTALAGDMLHFFRDSDIVGRLGGDEFIVLLKDVRSPETAAAKASAFCEHAKRIKELHKLESYVSVSIGVSVAMDGAKGFQLLYREADEALYKVKADGKGGCALYEDKNGASA